MSKGARFVGVRFPEEEWNAMLVEIARGEKFRADEPWTLSAFIRKAVKEKIAKAERSRASRKGKGAGAG